MANTRSVRETNVDYKYVFEALPGEHLLLLPLDENFIVVGVSNRFLEEHAEKKTDIIGSTLGVLLSRSLFKHEEQCILESLHKARVTLQPTFITIQNSSDNLVNQYERAPYTRIMNTPVLNKEGDIQFIIQSFENINEVKQKPLPERSKHNEFDESFTSLQESEKQYRELIENATVATAIYLGNDMTIQLANEAMLRYWGKDKSVLGKPLHEAVPELTNQPIFSLLKQVYSTGTTYHSSEDPALFIIGGELKTFYFNFTYKALRNSDGSIYGVLNMAVDVSDTVRARKAINEAEERLRLATEGAGLATWDLQLQTRSIIYSPRLPEIFGYERTAKLSHPDLRNHIHHDDLYIVEKAFSEALRHGVYNYDARIIWNDKSVHWIRTLGQVFYDEDGKPVRMLGTMRDITSEQQAAQTLRENEERLSIAIHSAELGTWDYYPLTEDFHCSDRTKELHGIAKATELTFQQMLTAVHPKDKSLVLRTIEQALRPDSNVTYRIEFLVIGIEDKVERWIRATGQAFYNDRGVAYRLTGTVLDITERKRIEEELEERVKQRTSELLLVNKYLERSNQELEQYAYVASHDLQEPLRKILVYGGMLKSDKDILNHEASARLDKIMASAERMSDLIKDLLDFSRLLKEGETFLPVDLNEIVNNLLNDFELKIQETNAKVLVGHLPKLEGSPQQINHLFYNVISNGMKFRKKDSAPCITISVAKLTADQVASQEHLNPSLPYVDITVSDNGIGFPAEYSGHIFELFKRLHTRDRYPGTGIGLALCLKIARNHHGTMYAEAIEGEGSTFHIVLPLHQ